MSAEVGTNYNRINALQYSFEDSGAFVETFEIQSSGSGPLDGLRFAAKDLIDVAGYTTGCGNPTWRDTHSPAVAHAVCVEQMLLAGARCVGKTVTDELAFGLDGENFFYGTPLNPAAPDRVPGGSSSGSASAVACGLVDFALGTDTGGSVRIPANNCGIFGLRPSHGRVSVAGVMPFAPGYDTVGVLAADALVLDRVARVLVACEPRRTADVGIIYLIEEAFTSVDEEVRDALTEPLRLLDWLYGDRVQSLSLRTLAGISGGQGLEPWFDTFHLLQWAEIWSTLGSWIDEHHPAFGPRTERNFDLARGLDRSRLSGIPERREAFFRALQQFLQPRDLLCLPTAPALPPIQGSLPLNRSKGSYYPRTVSLVSIAGIGRLPQVSMPLATAGTVPVGLSLLAKHGEDALLLDAMAEVVQAATHS